MKRPGPRWLAALLIVVATGFGLLNLFAYRHAKAMTHFVSGGERTEKPEQLTAGGRLKVLLTGVQVPRPVSGQRPTDLDPACREVTIDAGSGVNLSAWYGNRGAKTALVILFHGYAAEKTSLLPEARALLDMGTSVLLVDFRGSGGSSESYTTIGVREADDVAAAVRFARSQLRHDAVVLFGQSMGAAAVLRAVRECGVSPDAVVLEAVFDTMLHTVGHRFEAMGLPSFPGAQLLVFWGGRAWGFNGFKHRPMDDASVLRSPALFMHGARDPRATLAEGRRVFEAVPGPAPKFFVVFPSAGHQPYLATAPVEWKTAVSELLAAAKEGVPEGGSAD